MLTNGNGCVMVENGEAIGYCGDEEIGRLPLPLSANDAEMMVRLCTRREIDDRPFGLTAELFIANDLIKEEGGRG